MLQQAAPLAPIAMPMEEDAPQGGPVPQGGEEEEVEGLASSSELLPTQSSGGQVRTSDPVSMIFDICWSSNLRTRGMDKSSLSHALLMVVLFPAYAATGSGAVHIWPQGAKEGQRMGG